MKKRIVGTLFALVLVTSASGRERAVTGSRGGQTVAPSPAQAGKGKWAGYGTTIAPSGKPGTTQSRGSFGSTPAGSAGKPAPTSTGADQLARNTSR
jgi:hypothetical protein